jgi:hypothetical protein
MNEENRGELTIWHEREEKRESACADFDYAFPNTVLLSRKEMETFAKRRWQKSVELTQLFFFCVSALLKSDSYWPLSGFDFLATTQRRKKMIITADDYDDDNDKRTAAAAAQKRHPKSIERFQWQGLYKLKQASNI